VDNEEKVNSEPTSFQARTKWAPGERIVWIGQAGERIVCIYQRV
jgi:hypothetical protein